MSIETLLLALLVELAVAMLKFITGLNSDLAQVYATIIPAFFSSVFIVILAWDRLVDKPKLKLKMECKTELLDRRCSPQDFCVNLVQSCVSIFGYPHNSEYVYSHVNRYSDFTNPIGPVFTGLVSCFQPTKIN